jgi:hypothetical protein
MQNSAKKGVQRYKRENMKNESIEISFVVVEGVSDRIKLLYKKMINEKFF